MATANSTTALLESAYDAVSRAFNALFCASSCMDDLAEMFHAIYKLSDRGSTIRSLAGTGKYLSEDWSNIFDSEREEAEAVFNTLRTHLNKGVDSAPAPAHTPTDDAALLDSARKAALSGFDTLNKSSSCMDKLAGMFSGIVELSTSGDTVHSLAGTGNYLSKDWSSLFDDNLKGLKAALEILFTGLGKAVALDSASAATQPEQGGRVAGAQLALEELRTAAATLKARYDSSPEGWQAAFAERDAILSKLIGLSGAKNPFEQGFAATVAEFAMGELEGAPVTLGDWRPEAVMTAEELLAHRNQLVAEALEASN